MAVISSPGTFSSLLLRFTQSILAALSFVCVLFNTGFCDYNAFKGLYWTMAVQSLWSLGLGCFDAYAMNRIQLIPDSALCTLFLVCDWLVGGLTLAATSSSGAVVLYFMWDTSVYNFESHDCKMAMISVGLALLSWVFIAVSALVSFWLRASSSMW